MVRVMVIGCHSRLGAALSRTVAGKFEVFGIGRQWETWLPNGRFYYYRQDPADRKALVNIIKRVQPHFIINTVAFSDIDRCEEMRELTHQINVQILQHVILAAKRVGAVLIQISTDQVFDGSKIGFYVEDDRPNPINYFGQTKWIGENMVRASGLEYCIIRTSTLCMAGAGTASTNLAGWLNDRLARSQPVEMSTEEFRNPTCVDNLAANIWKIIRTERTGLYHVAGKSSISLYDFARRIAVKRGYDPELVRLRRHYAAVRARRPLNCSLSTVKAEDEFGARLHSLDDIISSICGCP